MILHRKENTDKITYGVDKKEFKKAIEYKPDYVIVSNPASMRSKIVKSLLERTSANILIEKPISSKYRDIRYWNLDTLKNRKIQVGYNLRFLPSLIKFRKIIKDGVVGAPLSVRAEVGQYLPDWRKSVDYRASVSARRELGGGVLFELSHEIDYLTWMFGRAVWVSAWTGKKSNLEINVEDTCFLTMCHSCMENGTEIITQLNLDMVRKDRKRTCTVIGETGTIIWDGISGEIKLFSKDKWHLIYSKPELVDNTYVDQLRNFMKKDLKQFEFQEKLNDAMMVLKTIVAAKRSARMRSKIVNVVE
jgi:predicted dehydrogenase